MTPATLEQLAERYDAFLIDQFGVLLSGGGAYPGAAQALDWLARQPGKRIVLLSNSGKRAAPNAARLERLGFRRDSFETVLSSGEAAHGLLARRIAAGDISAGARVLLLARDGDLSAIDGLDLRATDDPTQANLILIAGSLGAEIGLDGYRAILSDPAARRVPALCTNPDMTMLTANGPDFGAGRIAELYETMGGTVERIGKPHRLIYDIAREMLGDPARVICIGDSPDHDILGAANAGFDSALVRTGIHAGLDDAARLALCDAAGARPTHVTERFALQPR